MEDNNEDKNTVEMIKVRIMALVFNINIYTGIREGSALIDS